MIRILHMIETGGPGGAEQVLIRIVKELQSRGIQCEVLLLKDTWLADELRKNHINTYILPLKRSFHPLWMVKVIQYIKKRNINCLHSHEFAMNCHSAIISRCLGLNCVTTVHGKNYYTDTYLRRYMYKIVSLITNMVAVSDDIKEYLVNKVNISPKNITVIKNGIITNKRSYDLNIRTKIRNELGVAGTTILIGAIGNLYPVKGHIYLLKAINLIVKKQNNIHLIIAGRGKEENNLRKYIEDNNLSDYITLLGYRDDVAELLSAIDIFVMPSISEGLPMALLEAMVVGKPVVVSNVGGMPEVVMNRNTGILYEYNDYENLAYSIIELINDDELRNNISMNAKNLVKNKYSFNEMIDKYIELYQM